jgi:hypothetical protein
MQDKFPDVNFIVANDLATFETNDLSAVTGLVFIAAGERCTMYTTNPASRNVSVSWERTLPPPSYLLIFRYAFLCLYLTYCPP